MKDRLVHDNMMDIDEHRDGCSHAVALGAAPASATDGFNSDIARGMGLPPVNPLMVTSAMGRGADHHEIGESPHRLKYIRDTGYLQHGANDESKDDDHQVN